MITEQPLSEVFQSDQLTEGRRGSVVVGRNSEVARLREQIELEYEAGRLALYGPAQGTARHEIIVAHMERAQQYGQQLIDTLGRDEAIPIIIAAIDEGHDKAEARFK